MRQGAAAALVAAALVFLLPAPLGAQRKKLSIEDLTAEPPIAGRPVSALAWLPDGRRFSYIVRRGEGIDSFAELWLEEAASGRKNLVLSSTGLSEAPAETEQTPPDVRKAPPPPRKLSLERHGWAPDGSSLVVVADEELWLYRVATKHLERITSAPGAEEHPSFSPDGGRIAFVRKNDLYVLDVASRRETRLTRDGSDSVHNGKLDWVYEEELAGRDSRAYHWSPDGKRIAYLRLDDAPVTRYPLTDFLEIPPAVEWQFYPKAGTPNPIPALHVISVEGRALGSQALAMDGYIVPGFSWTRDSRSVAYRTLNRDQNRLELRLFTPGGGAPTVLLVEEDPYWINVFDPPRFLADGRYLWRSERSGWAHLYLVRPGGAPQPITSGEWMVDRVIGVDEKTGLVYFTANEEDVRRRGIYRVELGGRSFTRIAGGEGTHAAELSPDGQSLLATRSTVREPPVVSLLSSQGRSVRVVIRPESRLGEYALATTEEVELPGDDGARLEARLVKPADFDPARRYPVVVFMYGGPHSQVVRDNWGATSLLDHLLASRGFLVWSLDNRGSWGRGHAWESAIFRSMGKRELADQLAGIRYLKSLPFVDPARIGVWGWSYGGYMTLFAMTNAPEVWKCGFAGAPVTHWKFYDTIYTERYMRTPRSNPEGYAASAPLTRAADLRAPLLLMHGTADDNVHMQNTVAFVDALTKAGREHAVHLLPGQKHGLRGRAAVNFRNASIVRFFEENL
ncbi:MAG: DPP IV N-terminal domain-containing protein [Thermoanaerobaculia bacterium]